MAPKAEKTRGKRKKRVLDPVALERERAEEAERHRRELAMLQGRLNEIVEQEKSMYEVSINAIEARWIGFLRQCKQKELVKEIKIVRRAFETTLDRKDAVIAMLFADLDEVEEQQRHVFRSHAEVTDSLIELHNRHVADLEREFEHDLLLMKGDFESERAELERRHEMEMSNLRLVLQNLATEAESLERKLQEEISETHETAMERMDEERKQLESRLLHMSEALRNELDARYKEFVSTAQVNMKEYTEKAREDEETTEHIAAQLKKIDKLQESVASWRTNIARNAREWEKRNAAIQAERDATLTHLKTLKTRMQRWRQQRARELVEMVKDAKDCENVLDSTTKKAERILRLVELCKPLETEREMVLSHESHLSPAEIEEEVKRRVAAMEPGALRMDKDIPHGAAAAADWQFLERFWTKHNKVVLDNAAIAQERHQLEHENAQLQQVLKQYLDDVSVNDDVMRQHNTLLQTRAIPSAAQTAVAATTSRQASRGDGVVYNTVVEGNKFVADVARQRVR